MQLMIEFPIFLDWTHFQQWLFTFRINIYFWTVFLDIIDKITVKQWDVFINKNQEKCFYIYFLKEMLIKLQEVLA